MHAPVPGIDRFRGTPDSRTLPSRTFGKAVDLQESLGVCAAMMSKRRVARPGCQARCRARSKSRGIPGHGLAFKLCSVGAGCLHGDGLEQEFLDVALQVTGAISLVVAVTGDELDNVRVQL